MKTATVAILCFASAVFSQGNNEDKNILDQIFTSPRTDDFLPGYEEVTRASGGSLGALEKCGEGSDQGVHLCVPYFQCDGRTNLIAKDGKTDGFGIIDIRFGANSCPHPLDVCCGVPTNLREPDLPGPEPSQPVEPPSPPPQEDYQPKSCGIRQPNGIDFKITGNKDHEAEYGEFPWMVAVLKRVRQEGENLAVCGGSMIAPNVVLTGAHCVFKFKSHELKIRAGEWDTQTTKERLPYQERDVDQIITHEDYNAKTVYNDVALLILSSPVAVADHIGFVCLPEQNQRVTSRNCFASGWGKDVFGKRGQFQVILKKIELPIVQRADCERALRTTRLGGFFSLHDSFVCAGGEEGKDTCTGDGGSPLVCPDPQNPGRYLQVGMVAWGIGCGEENIPGVYADVSKFRSWVDSQLQRLNVPSDSYVK